VAKSAGTIRGGASGKARTLCPGLLDDETQNGPDDYRPVRSLFRQFAAPALLPVLVLRVEDADDVAADVELGVGVEDGPLVDQGAELVDVDLLQVLG